VTDAIGRRIVNIDKPRFTIGRHKDVDLQVAAVDASRVHAEIAFEHGGHTLRDRHSRFGTFVNGRRTAQKALAHGDQIRLGQTGVTTLMFLADVDVD
jgi:pSer/pThr/pTyr-binding forkhead associated (FHA) protein